VAALSGRRREREGGREEPRGRARGHKAGGVAWPVRQCRVCVCGGPRPPTRAPRACNRNATRARGQRAAPLCVCVVCVVCVCAGAAVLCALVRCGGLCAWPCLRRPAAPPAPAAREAHTHTCASCACTCAHAHMAHTYMHMEMEHGTWRAAVPVHVFVCHLLSALSEPSSAQGPTRVGRRRRRLEGGAPRRRPSLSI
jgi:hypothetical protein